MSEPASLTAVVLFVLTLGGILVSPRVRALLTAIALRRFFDSYMSQKRYKVYRPQDPDPETDSKR